MGLRPNKPSLLIAIYQNPDYYPPTFNAAAILRDHFDVQIVARNVDPSFRQWPNGIEVHREGEFGTQHQKAGASAFAKFHEYRGFVGAISDTIRAIHPRMIYAYEPHAFTAVLRSGASSSGIPIVYQLHELMDPAGKASLQGMVGRYAIKRTRAADTLVFPERNRAAAYMNAAGDTRSPLIVPNCPMLEFGPQMNDAESAELAKRRLARREIVYLGWLGPDHSNLESVHALGETGADTRMTLVGGSQAEFVRQLRDAATVGNTEDRLTLTGRVGHAELRSFLLNACIGLVLYKPVSKNLEYIASATNKLFEYAAFGLPAIVPDLPNFHEFLRDEIWVEYADPYSPSSIAAAIRRILADRGASYAARSAAAQRFFRKRYHYEAVFAPVLERIRQLAATPQHAQVAGR